MGGRDFSAYLKYFAEEVSEGGGCHPLSDTNDGGGLSHIESHPPFQFGFQHQFFEFGQIPFLRKVSVNS